MLPFDMPELSRGHAELSPGARAVGVEVAAAAAAALSSLLGREVAIRGRTVPCAPAARAAAARVEIELAALPAGAALELDPALVVRLVDALAGGPGEAMGATALTPVETATLELLALVALDGACSVAVVESALAPRLARGAARPTSPLAVELEISAGALSGRGRLLVAHAAVRALRGAPGDAAAGGGAIALPVSLRSGSTRLDAPELDALCPGDVVIVDPPADGRDDLVLPGGARLRGRRSEEGFHLEETTMSERHAQLPVTLEVELARLEIPLGELARLEPGAALALPVDRRGLVTLRAGERAVARGELVELDGAIGVRILSVEVAP